MLSQKGVMQFNWPSIKADFFKERFSNLELELVWNVQTCRFFTNCLLALPVENPRWPIPPDKILILDHIEKWIKDLCKKPKKNNWTQTIWTIICCFLTNLIIFNGSEIHDDRRRRKRLVNIVTSKKMLKMPIAKGVTRNRKFKRDGQPHGQKKGDKKNPKKTRTPLLQKNQQRKNKTKQNKTKQKTKNEQAKIKSKQKQKSKDWAQRTWPRAHVLR